MRNGLWAVMAGYLPAAMAFGALARVFHMPSLMAWLLSLIVYSGALQSATLGLWVVGANPVMILVMGLFVNLRHMFYGPHLDQVHPHWTTRARLAISPILTDEVYAVGVDDPDVPPRALWVLALVAFGSWQIGTWAGLIIGQAIPSRWLDPFALALPALFLGLTLPRLTSTAAWAGAVTAGIVAWGSRFGHWPAAFLALPIVVGTSVAYFWDARSDPIQGPP